MSKNKTAPPTPPTRDNPGKYGKSRNTNGFKKFELGFRIIYMIRDAKIETASVIKAMLKALSTVMSFRIRRKSLRVKRYNAKRKIKKQIKISKRKKCIFLGKYKEKNTYNKHYKSNSGNHCPNSK